jgi:glutathione peroxidase
MTDLQDIEFSGTDGTTHTLAEHHGQVVLVVNVASRCGLTPQYTALQRLYEERREQGFTVLAFPANDFAGQEPGTDAEIAEFCATTYDVTFPVLSKVRVVGEQSHPLYRALTAAVPRAEGKDEMRERLRSHGMAPTEDPEILWNFEKFLLARDGRVVGRFAPAVAPDDPGLLGALERELRAPSTTPA